jgi:hypothetical protein
MDGACSVSYQRRIAGADEHPVNVEAAKRQGAQSSKCENEPPTQVDGSLTYLSAAIATAL